MRSFYLEYMWEENYANALKVRYYSIILYYTIFQHISSLRSPHSDLKSVHPRTKSGVPKETHQ